MVIVCVLLQSVLDEMSNVLKYVDDESISQMVLQMTEQVRDSDFKMG